MFCSQCGADIAPSSSFCQKCGAMVAGAGQQPPPASQAPPPGGPPQPPYMVPPPAPGGYVPPRQGFPTWVVVVIIAAVVFVGGVMMIVPRLTTNTAEKNSQRRTCQANLRTVDGAIMSYEALFDDPMLPGSLKDLTQPGTRVLKSIPTCPSGTKPYEWVEGDGEGYDPPYISCPNLSTHTI
ncbi:MAG: zinc ribbon domain-containing protein [Actinobacteria bacterium]|nr:zinc ribbon domain-containing protein [Actinomycetota bacterium]MBU1943830.1 zinc ribbon domain-containing protein [Actinomycetota bacterium]MBU2689009.1 zinc ribbon domain-containing protein [Actinomycetota bacterium]